MSELDDGQDDKKKLDALKENCEEVYDECYEILLELLMKSKADSKLELKSKKSQIAVVGE